MDQTNHGNRWLKTALVQSAWAASHSKNTSLSAGELQILDTILARRKTPLVSIYNA